MFFRACCVFVFLLNCCDAYSAQCNYEEHKGLLSRVIAVDPVNGPKAGGGASDAAPFELNDKEVILTFDGGPHPAYTGYILDILDRNCVKATFFFSGAAALAHPSAVRDAASRGHTIAAGAWQPARKTGSSTGREEEQIEKGFAAIAKASGGSIAPFYRTAQESLLPQRVLDYLKGRGVALWSGGIASGDDESELTPTKLANRALLQIQQKGKGVIEFHDTRKITVDALDSILMNLRLDGYKVVHIVPVSNLTPKEEALAELAAAPAKPAVSAPRAQPVSRRREWGSDGERRERLRRRREESH